MSTVVDQILFLPLHFESWSILCWKLRCTPRCARSSSRWLSVDYSRVIPRTRYCARDPASYELDVGREPDVGQRNSSSTSFWTRPGSHDWSRRRWVDLARCWSTPPRIPLLPPSRCSRRCRTETWWCTCWKRTDWWE